MENPSVDNVIFIVLDALRADRVGALSSDKSSLTPFIDTLAHDGTMFENAFSCINTTSPSLTSIHTGKYPRSTVYHQYKYLTDVERRRIESCHYVPELLSEEGVFTVTAGRYIGRWHKRGFDYYPDIPIDIAEHEFKQSIRQRLSALSPVLRDAAASAYRPVRDLLGLLLSPFKKEQSHEERGVDEFLGVLDSDRYDGDPFYGFIHLFDTHFWYDPDSDIVDRLLSERDYPNRDLESFFEEYNDRPYLQESIAKNATEEDWETGLARLLARYDATVVEADRKVKQLVEGLKQRGEWKNTALFVFSDHGESLLEHEIHFDHHGLYDETIRVPLVARIPDIETDAVTEFVQLHDLAPTLLDLFDVDASPQMDGVSLLERVGDCGGVEPRNHLIVEEAHAQRRVGVRTERWKYITHVRDERLEEERGSSFECGYCNNVHGDKVELYDLKEDPEERINLAEDYPDVVSNMESKLTEFEKSLSFPDKSGTTREYGDEEAVRQRLEELGYR